MARESRLDRQLEVVPSPKWVRVFFANQVVADSKNALLLRAHGQLPVYYFPERDVRMEYLRAAVDGAPVADQGEGPWPDPPVSADVYTVQVGDVIAENAAWHIPEPFEEYPELQKHVAFAWQAMDAWYEEDAQIHVHPHDPYHAVDVRPSTRHVRVVVHGVTVAETIRPVLVFETGLRTRFYIPKTDIRMDLIVPDDYTTHCAYKGTAPHYSLEIDGDRVERIAWSYSFPNPGFELIQNLIAFYQERIADFFVDGERLQDTPRF